MQVLGTMTRKKSKPDETRMEVYGRGEVLDEHAVSGIPERDLWAAVILQAMVNVHFKSRGWEQDLYFLSGGNGFSWICDQLGLNEKLTSIGAIKMAFNRDMIRFIKKH